jgi:hypothetical protein
MLLQAGGATDPPTPEPGVAIKGADMALLSAVRKIGERVASMRGEGFDRPPVAVRAPEELRAAAAEIRAYNIVSRHRLEARGRAWSDVGLGAPTLPSRLYLALASDVQGVGLDPGADRLLFAPDRLTESDFFQESDKRDESPATLLLLTGVRVDEPLTAHLLMHLRQRERLGGEFLGESTDALLARAAWAEGEANVLSIRYLFEGMGLEDDILESGVEPAEVLGGALVPPGIVDLGGPEAALLRFVYVDGFHQAVEVYKSDGWAGLTRRLKDDPTTRGVLHPNATFPAPHRFPEPVEPPVEGLHLIDTDVLGEQGVITLISNTTGKDDLALQAGDGWAGDRLRRWESENGGAITEWLTRWARPEDVEDIDYAFARSLVVRFGRESPAGPETGVRVLRTPDHVIRLERAPQAFRVLIGSGAAGEALGAQPAPEEANEAAPVDRAG